LESYFEYNLYGLDIDKTKDLSIVSSESESDYYNYSRKINYSLDSFSKNNINIENNPGLFEEFLNWRDHQVNFFSDISFSKNNLIFNIDKKINKSPYFLDTYKSLLSKNTNEFITSSPFFDSYSNNFEIIKNFYNFSSDGFGSLSDFNNISSGLGLEFSEMVPLVYDEIGNFSSTISSFFLKIIFIVKI
jgi:hypothetical protein